jgi:prophage regulatory protein
MTQDSDSMNRNGRLSHRAGAIAGSGLRSSDEPSDPGNLGNDGAKVLPHAKRAQRFKAGIADVEPLCLGADEVAALLGIGKTLLFELDSAGRIPAPLKLGNRCVWAISELRAWVAAGCPDRQRWQTLRRSHF